MTSFKNKTLASFLAAVLGTFGVHRFYLQGARSWLPWLYPMYFFAVGAWGLQHIVAVHPDVTSDLTLLLHPALLIACVPTFAGFLEAIVFALTPDAKWDAQFNATSTRTSDSNWVVIVIAILTLAIGATALMSALAISIQRYYEDEAASNAQAFNSQTDRFVRHLPLLAAAQTASS